VLRHAEETIPINPVARDNTGAEKRTRNATLNQGEQTPPSLRTTEEIPFLAVGQTTVQQPHT